MIVILILNVLIAVVNDAYAENKEIKTIEKSKTQLSFIINRWPIRRIVCRGIFDVHYIITAFDLKNENNDQEQIMKKLNQLNSDLQFMML